MNQSKRNNFFFSCIVSCVLIAEFFCTVSCKARGKVKSEEITFSWWGNDRRNEYTLKGIELFEEKNPEIKVLAQHKVWKGYEEAYDEKIKSGTECDVMQINFDWLYKYSDNGNGYYDLNRLSSIIDLSNFTLNDLSYGMRSEKLNGIPIAFNSIIPVFDETTFRKYGLKIPESWNDLFKSASVMKADGIYPLGLGPKHLFLFLIAWFEQTYNKSFFQDNYTFNLSREEVEGFFGFLNKLIEEKVIYPDAENFDRNLISKGKIAGVVCWCSETSVYSEGFNGLGHKAVLGNFITQENSKKTGWYLKPATLYAVSKHAENPEACGKLVNFLLNDPEMAELQGCEKGIPAGNSALTTLMEKHSLSTMEYDALMNIRFRNSDISQMLPVMENKNVINAFSTCMNDQKDRKKTTGRISEEFCTSVRKTIEESKI